MKDYKKTIIITTLVTLLPILLGIILWEKLPDSIDPPRDHPVGKTSGQYRYSLGSGRSGERLVKQGFCCIRTALYPRCDPPLFRLRHAQ